MAGVGVPEVVKATVLDADPAADPVPERQFGAARPPGIARRGERYKTTPVLIETFVETPRYTGAVYKASGWTRVGTTQGRGRYDTLMKRAEPRKDIWLRPLRRDWKRTLNR